MRRLRTVLPLLLLPALAGVLAWQARPADGQEPPAAAAEPGTLPYTATLVPTGEGDLDGPLQASSRLIRLAEQAPVDAQGLIARAAAEPPLLQEVLQAEGFWAGRVNITLAGEPPTSPGLAERLARMDGPVPVEIRVEPGPRYTIASISIRPQRLEDRQTVAALEAGSGLSIGDPARAAPVLDAEAQLLSRLRDSGHPLASVVDREVVVDHDRRVMEVAWTLAPGPVAHFAAPQLEGETQVDRRLIERVAGQMKGEQYSPRRQEEVRRDILALGAFDTVRARAAERLDPAGNLPVTFTVTDRPRRAVGFSLAYETNYGPTASAYWEHRNLFGNAERLRLEAEVSRLGAGGGTEDTGFRLGASLRRPGLLDGRTSLLLELGAVRERLEAYDRDVITAGATLERPVSENLVLRAGPVFEVGEIGRRGDLQPVTLVGFQMGARWDNTGSLLDPRRGFRASATVTPYQNFDEGGSFTRILTGASTYLNLTGNGGSVLALRAAFGSAIGGDELSLPLDKRFYAGGGGSVRGYSYQGIGPRDALGRVEGGRSLLEGSIELRQRISGPIGMAVFLDAGTVGEQEIPDFSLLRFGAGLGVRYATAIGPLRADIGIPLNREAGEGTYGLYVGLGQAF